MTKHNIDSRSKQAGLSLIEMAVVLVIIAVLAGVILKGRALITQSTVRKVATQVEGLQTALQSYRSAYGDVARGRDHGKALFNTLYEAQLIAKPGALGYPHTALGGHFYLIERVNGLSSGIWLVIGNGVQGDDIQPFLPAKHIAHLRRALGIDEDDESFVVEGPGCKKAVEQLSDKKCLVLIFVCD